MKILIKLVELKKVKNILKKAGDGIDPTRKEPDIISKESREQIILVYQNREQGPPGMPRSVKHFENLSKVVQVDYRKIKRKEEEAKAESKGVSETEVREKEIRDREERNQFAWRWRYETSSALA